MSFMPGLAHSDSNSGTTGGTWNPGVPFVSTQSVTSRLAGFTFQLPLKLIPGKPSDHSVPSFQHLRRPSLSVSALPVGYPAGHAAGNKTGALSTWPLVPPGISTARSCAGFWSLVQIRSLNWKPTLTGSYARLPGADTLMSLVRAPFTL